MFFFLFFPLLTVSLDNDLLRKEYISNNQEARLVLFHINSIIIKYVFQIPVTTQYIYMYRYMLLIFMLRKIFLQIFFRNANRKKCHTNWGQALFNVFLKLKRHTQIWHQIWSLMPFLVYHKNLDPGHSNRSPLLEPIHPCRSPGDGFEFHSVDSVLPTLSSSSLVSVFPAWLV